MIQPRITALIPVWNGAHEIHLLLDALARQTLGRDRFDVIVVDNGSTDGTSDVVKQYPFVTLLSEPRPGSYQARNTGIEHVTTEYIAFTDADCIPARDWLEKALKAIQSDERIGVIAGRIALFRATEEDSEICEAYEQIFGMNQETYVRQNTCATANWTSSAMLLRELGGFNTALRSGGDFQLAQAVIKSGRTISYRDDVIVNHPIRGTFAVVVKKRMRVLGGQWQIARNAGIAPPRFALTILATNYRRMRAIVRDKATRAGMKAQMLCLVAIITLASYKEFIRLLAGGTPRRA